MILLALACAGAFCIDERNFIAILHTFCDGTRPSPGNSFVLKFEKE